MEQIASFQTSTSIHNLKPASLTHMALLFVGAITFCLTPMISATSTAGQFARNMPRLPLLDAGLWGVTLAFRGGADFVSEEVPKEEQLVEAGETTTATLKEEEENNAESADTAMEKSDETSSEATETSVEESSSDSRTTASSAGKYGDPSKYIFTVYQPGDGSDKDPDDLPLRFLNMQKGNRAHAKQALETTQKFRKEENVDTILQRPHPTFDICKAITPHYFIGRDVTNHVVFFQRPAMVHLDLAKANEITNHDLVMHYVYVLEYCWNLLDPPVPTEDDGDEYDYNESHNTMTSIIDLTGLDFSILRHRELVGFVKDFVQMMSAHYPQRSYKTLLLNAPSWFGMLYKMLSPMLRESTKAKIEILSHGKHQTEKLRELLGDECLTYLPQELLETDKKKLEEAKEASTPESPMEEDFRNFCLDRLADAGEEMQPLISVD